MNMWPWLDYGWITLRSLKKSLLHKALFLSLPNDKMIYWSRFKAFPDENLNVAKIAKFVFDRVENNVEKKNSILSFSHVVFQSVLLWER